jgi:leader peptidase (prepilin peptidase) / N-methyltransferase
MSPQFVDWWLSHPSLFGMPFHFWTVFIVILGAFVGSFLNVCIHRMPLDQSVVNPPSHCPHCRYSIPWYLNIPVITWLWLRGRCRSCAAPISPRYLAVEVLTAALFALCWVHFGHNDPGLALALCVLFSLFVVATFIDFEHFIIPDAITLGGAGAGLILSPLVPGLHATFSAGESLKRSALGIAIGFGVVYGVVRLGKLLFGRERIPLEPGTRVVFHEDGIVLPDRTIPFGDIFYRKSDTIRMVGRHVELADRCYVEAEVRLNEGALIVGPDTFVPADEPYLAADATELVLPREAMGFGDVKFMATIGAFLGWQATLFTLASASVFGAVIGLSLIVIGRREWSARLPFGPYLTAGAILWLFGGSRFWAGFIGY